MMATAAIIVAAGRGQRMNDPDGTLPKQLKPLAGKPVLAYSVEFFDRHPAIDYLCIVTRDDLRSLIEAKGITRGLSKPLFWATGGARRQDSTRNGLQAIPADADIIVVHDAVRPFPSSDATRQAIELARSHGGAIVAAPLADTLKRVDDNGKIATTIDRSSLWLAQTPQVFQRSLLERAYGEADRTGAAFTDEASACEAIGGNVRIVLGAPTNLKITTAEDLDRAEAIARDWAAPGETSVMANIPYRIGQGVDVHAFAEDRKLVLGGVEIPYERGLAGHSDADVLTHAICDAILGALGQGDIGRHFPDTDPQYKGIDSLLLLEHVVKLVASSGYVAAQIDATVIAQAPKLAPHIPQMIEKLQGVLGAGCIVNVKATTTENLGFAGRGEGVAAQAIASLCLMNK